MTGSSVNIHYVVSEVNHESFQASCLLELQCYKEISLGIGGDGFNSLTYI